MNVKKRNSVATVKKCLRCGNEWTSKLERPKQCPACKQPAWDRPSRRTKTGGVSGIKVSQDSIFDAIAEAVSKRLHKKGDI